MIQTHTIITKNARLPFETIKGNVETRNKKAHKLTKIFANNIDKINNSDSCSLNEFKTVLEQTIAPNKIRLDLRTSKEKDYKAAVGRIIEGKTIDENHLDVFIKGFHLKISQKSNPKLKLKKEYAVHEARHIFDYLTQPKIISVRLAGCEDSTIERLRTEFRNTFLNPTDIPNKDYKKYAQKKTAGMSDEVAIDIMQSTRNSLITEKNAYKEEYNYLRKNPIKNFSKIYGIKAFLKYSFPIEKRIKIINDVLKERIKLARNAQCKS